jgi:hypothetical protein
MFYPPDEEEEIEVAIPQQRKQPRSIDSFSLSTAPSQEQIQKECLNNLAKNENISSRLRKKLCKIINGIWVDTGSDSNQKDKFNELMSLWYYDSVLIEEIYETLKKNGLRMTKEITCLAKIEPPSKPGWNITDDGISYRYFGLYVYVDEASGLQGEALVPLDLENFKHTEIDKFLSSDELFAIPFGFSGTYFGDGRDDSHQNMIIVKKYTYKDGRKSVIECELFEPHGKYYNGDKNASNFIIARVGELMRLLFDPNKHEIIVLTPEQICPLVESEENEVLQGLTYDEWGGSCAIFSMWYAFLRLLNPRRSVAHTYRLMNDFLKTSPTKNKIIRLIVSAFISLVSVDLDTFTINKKYTLSNKNQKNIREKQQQLLKDISPMSDDLRLYSKGGRKKTIRRCKTIIKKRTNKNNKTIKIINSKRKKTKIKRKYTR